MRRTNEFTFGGFSSHAGDAQFALPQLLNAYTGPGPFGLVGDAAAEFTNALMNSERKKKGALGGYVSYFAPMIASNLQLLMERRSRNKCLRGR